MQSIAARLFFSTFTLCSVAAIVAIDYSSYAQTFGLMIHYLIIECEVDRGSSITIQSVISAVYVFGIGFVLSMVFFSVEYIAKFQWKRKSLNYIDK